MLQLIHNRPLDVRAIAKLVKDPLDLRLMMPSAKFPFDEKQWRDCLKEEHSYFIRDAKSNLGHFAFLRLQKDHAWLSLIYLRPEFRRSNHSRKLMALAEKTARESLQLKTLFLRVKDYNLPALRLYKRVGYEEFERNGSTISMKKSLCQNVKHLGMLRPIPKEKTHGR